MFDIENTFLHTFYDPLHCENARLVILTFSFRFYQTILPIPGIYKLMNFK